MARQHHKNLIVRITMEDEQLLRALVARQLLAEKHVRVTASSVVRLLIHRAAKEANIKLPKGT